LSNGARGSVRIAFVSRPNSIINKEEFNLIIASGIKAGGAGNFLCDQELSRVQAESTILCVLGTHVVESKANRQTSPAIVENQELESLFRGEIFVDKNNSGRTRRHQLSCPFFLRVALTLNS
jgi:hypothetical protein